MLRAFGTDLWIAEGPVVSFYGFPYPTRMAVIRLANGDLFVWSPMALDGALRAEVDSLGRVAHLVSPNVLHHLWLADWKAAYPAARLYASPGLKKKRRDLAFDAELSDRPEPAWRGQIDQVRVGGNLFMTEIVFHHRASRSAIFADLIENFQPDWFKGWRGVLARLDGIVQPNYGAPRELRWACFFRRSARRSIQGIIDLAPERVVIAHGEMAERGGTEFIRFGFRWLLK